MWVVEMLEISKHSMTARGVLEAQGVGQGARGRRRDRWRSGSDVAGEARASASWCVREVLEHVAHFGGALEIQLRRGGLAHLVLEGLEQFAAIRRRGIRTRRSTRSRYCSAVISASFIGHLVGGAISTRARVGIAAPEGEDAEFFPHEGERLAQRARHGRTGRSSGPRRPS